MKKIGIIIKWITIIGIGLINGTIAMVLAHNYIWDDWGTKVVISFWAVAMGLLVMDFMKRKFAEEENIKPHAFEDKE